MNKTYDEILEEMKCAYFNECGERLDDNSQTAKRFEAVASELFALSCYGDYIFRQAFVQTATKDNLDRHGAVRNCLRKTASSAQGTLTFYIDMPVTEKTVINKNTVCSVENSPYLQYASTQDGVIAPGETSVTVPAAALGSGYAYNVAAGTVTVMVNAPVGISGVINDIAFTGGYDDESDSAYRNRIMNHYSISANGVNRQSLANAVLMLDFVTDCYIPDAQEPGEIFVIVATKNNQLTYSQIEQVTEVIDIRTLIGAVVFVQLARVQNFSISVEADIRAGFSQTAIRKQIESIVREICSACTIGQALQLNTISKELAALPEISSFNVYSKEAYGEVVPCGSESYLYLNSLVVKCFDE